MIYGLFAALSWGVSTLLAAVAARRIGTLRTVVLGEVTGLVGYLTLFFLGHFSLRGVGSTTWLLVLAGMIGVGGYLALYRGLESGHIGLVSAISACYGGVIAVLSVVLLHEQLTVDATVGIVATVAGVMLAVIRRAAAPVPGAPASMDAASGRPARSAMMLKMTATQRPGDETERQFGWQDMFVGPDADPRGIGGIFVHHGDERTVLAGYLHDYRLTLELKYAGLDADAMARRSVEPSDLLLLGLVRHLSDVERYWFRQVMAGEDASARYRQTAGDDHDRAFSDAVADPASVAQA
jgi:uncharacterized membrane protein